MRRKPESRGGPAAVLHGLAFAVAWRAARVRQPVARRPWPAGTGAAPKCGLPRQNSTCHLQSFSIAQLYAKPLAGERGGRSRREAAALGNSADFASPSPLVACCRDHSDTPMNFLRLPDANSHFQLERDASKRSVTLRAVTGGSWESLPPHNNCRKFPGWFGRTETRLLIARYPLARLSMDRISRNHSAGSAEQSEVSHG